MTALTTRIDETSAPPLNARRVAVLVPTTGGLARVVRLEEKPHLGQSTVTGEGDFRPLPIAADYHRLADGPLRALGDQTGPFHLTLSGRVEDGRSWELPVLIAHRFAAHGAVFAPVAEADIVVWATGAVDGTLAPAGAARHIGEKLAHSQILAEARPEARLVVALAPGPAAQEALAALPAGAECLPLATFDDIERLTAGVAEGVKPARPRPRFPRTGRWGAVALVALLVAIGFGGSILLVKETTLNRFNSLIRLERLSAPDRESCISAHMEGRPLAAETLRVDGEVATIDGDGATCALRFTNRAASPVTLTLDDGFAGIVIAGDSPVGRPMALSPGASYMLVFRAPPDGRSSRLLARSETETAALTITSRGERR
ncbi:hypothetical protein L1787_03075 [Acuticoccus sp. M5D2P5]|uniref:hypothetical protein n=1 Tax=Acuticoccus kalidii TaxID=2910977 RepID=UPI001F1EE4CF|nr:hypothetical protein [Acuticoccus kalidii]MCF3932397.1 hypothetical protein [Acuticoccus kalidii]